MIWIFFILFIFKIRESCFNLFSTFFCRSLTRILSNLLDERLDIIWKDLESQLLTSTVRRFMKVAEDLGIAMANVLAEKERNQKEWEEGVEFVTTNICKYIQ